MGRDKDFVMSGGHQYRFNPHAPMGRDHDEGGKTSLVICFNPHAPMGRDGNSCTMARRNDVSIHTPLWGATLSFIPGVQPLLVSIHTPLWGATKVAYGQTNGRGMFQSTRPYGARPYIIL